MGGNGNERKLLNRRTGGEKRELGFRLEIPRLMWKKAREMGEKHRRVRMVRLEEVSSRLGKVEV